MLSFNGGVDRDLKEAKQLLSQLRVDVQRLFFRAGISAGQWNGESHLGRFSDIVFSPTTPTTTPSTTTPSTTTPTTTSHTTTTDTTTPTTPTTTTTPLDCGYVVYQYLLEEGIPTWMLIEDHCQFGGMPGPPPEEAGEFINEIRNVDCICPTTTTSPTTTSPTTTGPTTTSTTAQDCGSETYEWSSSPPGWFNTGLGTCDGGSPPGPPEEDGEFDGQQVTIDCICFTSTTGTTTPTTTTPTSTSSTSTPTTTTAQDCGYNTFEWSESPPGWFNAGIGTCDGGEAPDPPIEDGEFDGQQVQIPCTCITTGTGTTTPDTGCGDAMFAAYKSSVGCSGSAKWEWLTGAWVKTIDCSGDCVYSDPPEEDGEYEGQFAFKDCYTLAWQAVAWCDNDPTGGPPGYSSGCSLVFPSEDPEYYGQTATVPCSGAP